MKDLVKIVLTIVITSLLWLVALQDANNNNLRKNEKEIWMPTLLIINDLKSVSEEGKHEVLGKKIDLLEKRWRSYSQGGEGPHRFYKEIIDLGKEKSTRKTNP